MQDPCGLSLLVLPCVTFVRNELLLRTLPAQQENQAGTQGQRRESKHCNVAHFLYLFFSRPLSVFTVLSFALSRRALWRTVQ